MNTYVVSSDIKGILIILIFSTYYMTWTCGPGPIHISEQYIANPNIYHPAVINFKYISNHNI